MTSWDVQTIAVPDGHLAYVVAGSGPPLVLLHGGALDHRLWAPQFGPLAREHRVLAVDARGHGWSSTPTKPFRHADDVAGLLEVLDLGPATLVGLSLGAGTVTETAIVRPDLVTAAVVSGAGIPEPDFRDPGLLAIGEEWERAAARGDRDAWLAAFLRLGRGPGRGPEDMPPGVDDAVDAMARRTLDAHIGEATPVVGTPVAGIRERAGEITVPALAMIGVDDWPDHRRFARELVEPLGGDCVELRGGHYPNLEDPDRFTAELLRFLGSLRARP